jgi:tetratricopeptide (TPR) repeat protein
MQEKILEIQHGSNDVDLRLATLSRLSLLYNAQNQFSRAEETLKDELKLRTEKSGAHNRDTLVTLCYLARVYKHRGKFKDAATLLKEVISI